ncbi:prevent-host-death family protein [Streptomyces sp. NPDC096030]|uniref:prevent-host-death family protein n=1 Tax=Streptomyces sp. NPDC096030 TaxID=3155423 RepID=UPI00332558CD
MSTAHIEDRNDAVTFTELSRNPRAVTQRAHALGEVRITHRDGEDFDLVSTTRREHEKTTLSTASRMFLALMKHDPSMRILLLALPDLFPWVRHFDEEEVRQFAVELFEALSDAAELGREDAVERVIISARATARVYADPGQRRQAESPLEGKLLGKAEIPE